MSYEQLRTTFVVAEQTRRSMRGNRSIDTKPEQRLRKALWAAGLRGYRKNVRNLPGKPDVVYGKAWLCVFLHGCYWHGCPICTRKLQPVQNAEYWRAKIESNRARDAKSEQALLAAGWKVIAIWECELKRSIEAAVDRVRLAVQADAG